MRPAGRLLLVAFAALALFFQSYATQTHFHELSTPSAVSAAQTQAAQAGKHHRLPSSDDPDTCPLCHSLYSGQYIAPSFAVYFLAILSVSLITTTSGMSPRYDAVSHSWRGRGPPHN